MITPGRMLKPERFGKSTGVEAPALLDPALAWQWEPFRLTALAPSWVSITQRACSSPALLLLTLANKPIQQRQSSQ